MSKKEELSGFQRLLSKIKRLVNEEDNDYDDHHSDAVELKPVSKKMKEQKEMVRKASEDFELPLESVSVMEVLEAFQEKNSLNMAELIKNVSQSLSTSALASLSDFIAISYSESYSQSISEKGYSLRNSMSEANSLSDSVSVSESLTATSIQESVSHSLYVSDSVSTSMLSSSESIASHTDSSEVSNQSEPDSENLSSSQSSSVSESKSPSLSQSLSVIDYVSESEDPSDLDSESISESVSDFISESEDPSDLASESISESVSDFISASESHRDSELEQDINSVSITTSDYVSESEDPSVLASESISESVSDFVSENDSDEVDSKHIVNLVEVADNVGEFVYEASIQEAQPWEDSENGNSWIGKEKEEDLQKSDSQQLSREFKNVVSGLSGLSSIIHNKGGKNHSIANDIFE